MSINEDISLDFHLHPAQLEVFQAGARYTVLAAGRRFGKSYLASVRAATKALDPRNTKRLPCWIVAPTQPQAKQIYWLQLMDMLHPLIDKVNSNEGLIYLKNRVQIGVKGADRPDSLRGVGLFDVVLDEFADMKPETWEAILRPALADVKGTALFIGTPKGRNHFYDVYQAAVLQNDNEWKAFHFTSVDNPFIDPAEIEQARATMASAVFRQEFMASFEAGGSDTFKAEWLKYVDEEPTVTENTLMGPVTKPAPGEWYVAVDLAGFADVEKASTSKLRQLDQTAIAIVKLFPRGERVHWYVKAIELGRWGVAETARRIVDAVEAVETLNLGVEKGALFNAVAPFLVDEARKRGIPLKVTPLTHGNKDKTDRIVWALQGKFEHGVVELQRGKWNKVFEDEFLHFPSKMVHDDSMDSLALVDQLAGNRVFHQVSEEDVADTYWQPIDESVGF